MESALITAYFCTHGNDLPREDSIQFNLLADAVLRWSLRHAQTRSEVKRIKAYLSRIVPVDKLAID